MRAEGRFCSSTNLVDRHIFNHALLVYLFSLAFARICILEVKKNKGEDNHTDHHGEGGGVVGKR